jgi:hypothetical protein
MYPLSYPEGESGRIKIVLYYRKTFHKKSKRLKLDNKIQLN